MWNLNIGREFERQMKKRISDHPEILHKWNKGHLIVYHPRNQAQFVEYKFGYNKIEVSKDQSTKRFKRKFFTNLRDQVYQISVYGQNLLLDNKEIEDHKPPFKDNEVAVMKCNRKYGHVLTFDSNLYIGWGEIYKVFNDIDSARLYCQQEENLEFEFHIYDSNYKHIEDNIFEEFNGNSR